MTTYEKFEKLVKKDPQTLNATGDVLAEFLGVCSSSAREAKRAYLKKYGSHTVSKTKDVSLSQKLNDNEKEIERLKQEFKAITRFKPTPQQYTIKKPKHNKSFSTIVILASDWHYEEEVISEKVSGLNIFNTKIADQRINLFFSNAVTLCKMMQKETEIDQVILALLGDFISGNIHDDISESCTLRPTEAILAVRNRIVAGIDFMLKNTDLKLIIPCHSGNHARTTKSQFHANEAGHSLEWMMYHFLAQHYESNKRVQFIVAEGYHSYVDINGFIIRFHHGHSINYGGGIGGLTIPVNKAIGNWNKGRNAHLDCFGHFHTSFDGGNFVSNGSLIGYSPYAVSIKAVYEKPSQTLFLVNNKHKEITMRCKIFLSE